MTTFPRLQEFNTEGLVCFRKLYLREIQESEIDLDSPNLWSYLDGTDEFRVGEYETAKELAESILSAIGTSDLYKLLKRPGLWAWLTHVLRDQLFKRARDGIWEVGELHRWYPSNPNNWLKGQRHLVRMPVLLRHFLGRQADHLLCGRPWILSEIREQLTSQQDMLNSVFQQVARSLYYDEVKGTLKRGAGGKGAGSPRRLAKIRQQLDVTWDLETLEPRQIIAMLPAEFERFKPSGES